MLGGADNPNGELPSYITGADICRASGMEGGTLWLHVIPE
ncbi:InsB [Shigella sonnei]|nr:InsB [Shigella sonnei]CTB97796.1 InsB [Shigella sonnei]CTD82912.1 InsB [Shigella sonnei]SRX44103.1 InsB [Shigella sonnei]